MPYFIISFRDEDGNWFLNRPGMWSDNYRDACQFKTRAEARKNADDAQGRLNLRADEWPSKVRVVEMRAMT